MQYLRVETTSLKSIGTMARSPSYPNLEAHWPQRDGGHPNLPTLPKQTIHSRAMQDLRSPPLAVSKLWSVVQFTQRWILWFSKRSSWYPKFKNSRNFSSSWSQNARYHISGYRWKITQYIWSFKAVFMVWPVKAPLVSSETVSVREKNRVGKGTDCKSRQPFRKLQ